MRKKIYFINMIIFSFIILNINGCVSVKEKNYRGMICNDNYRIEAYSHYPYNEYDIYIVDKNKKSLFVLTYDTEHEYIKDTCTNELIEFAIYRENQSQYPKIYYEIVQKVIFNTKTNLIQ